MYIFVFHSLVFNFDHQIQNYFNLQEKWNIEVSHYAPGVPIVLVGTKADLKTDPNTLSELQSANQKPVTAEEVCFFLPNFKCVQKCCLLYTYMYITIAYELFFIILNNIFSLFFFLHTFFFLGCGCL